MPNAKARCHSSQLKLVNALTDILENAGKKGLLGHSGWFREVDWSNRKYAEAAVAGLLGLRAPGERWD